MKLRVAGLFLTIIAAVGLPRTIAAQGSTDASVAVRFGTLGVGLEASKLLGSHLALRVGGSLFSASTSSDQSDISYDIKAKVHSASALIDLFPGARGNFHFTGGIATNPVTVTGTGKPGSTGTFTINDHDYQASQVGTLTLEGKFKSVAPYAGIGFGTPANKHSGLKFLFDLGAIIGQPTLTLTSTGSATNAQLAADLTAQRDKTEKDVRKYAKVYPVLSFGIGYRF